jgi:hypothetical protein
MINIHVILTNFEIYPDFKEIVCVEGTIFFVYLTQIIANFYDVLSQKKRIINDKIYIFSVKFVEPLNLKT